MAYEPALGIERLGTVKEIANAARVGVATVHRVLKGQPKVSPSTSRAVLEAVLRINEQKIRRAGSAPVILRRQDSSEDDVHKAQSRQ